MQEHAFNTAAKLFSHAKQGLCTLSLSLSETWTRSSSESQSGIHSSFPQVCLEHHWELIPQKRTLALCGIHETKTKKLAFAIFRSIPVPTVP